MNRPHEPARSQAKVLRPGAKWLCSTTAPASKQQKTLVTAATTKVRGSDQRLLVMKQCEGLVQELTDRDESWPFLKPVTRRDV